MNPSRKWSYTLLLIVVFLVSIFIIVRFLKKTNPVYNSDGKLNSLRLKKDTYQDFFRSVGTVIPLNTVDLFFPIRGEIILKEKWDPKVKKGEILAFLKNIHGENIPFHAPQDGVIKFKVKSGTLLKEKETFGELIDLDSLLVDSALGEEMMTIFQPGSKAVIHYGRKPVAIGKITEISKTQAKGGGQVPFFPVKIQFVNPVQDWLPGQFAKIDFIIHEEEGVISIPNKAVFGSKDSPKTLVLVNKIPTERNIVIGYKGFLDSVIKEGLMEGDVALYRETNQKN